MKTIIFAIGLLLTASGIVIAAQPPVERYFLLVIPPSADESLALAIAASVHGAIVEKQPDQMYVLRVELRWWQRTDGIKQLIRSNSRFDSVQVIYEDPDALKVQ